MPEISMKPAGHYPRARTCFFRHHWVKWETYIWEGLIYFSGPHYTTTTQNKCRETHQKRTCLRCGLEEDRLVKEG